MAAIDNVRSGFVASSIPTALIDELIEAFVEAKRRFYAADLRPNAIEGGRFSEAAFRVLQWQTSGQYTAIGSTLPRVDTLLATLVNATGSSDSVRIHIPRTLRLIYDVRNKRDIAHLADGIDPNLQDATLVVRNMEWVLAELVRMYHNVAPAEAQRMIEEIVTREIPAIQVVDGFPRVLKDLKASDFCLVLIFWAGASGVEFSALSDWVRPKMRTNLRRTLSQLEEKNYIHLTGSKIRILIPGERTVEESGLIQPA